MQTHQKSFLARFYCILLLPWSGLYRFIVQVRNLLYNYGIKKTHLFDVPIISIGNLSCGGTGKTPCIAYLIPLFENKAPILVLSRGYKRLTAGFLLAQPQDTALTIGDEPKQLHQQFMHHPSVKIAVAENRAKGIQKLLSLFPNPQVILLDDAFQHRRVKPKLNILLTNFHQPFFKDYVLPAGRLREPRGSAQRADMIVVTKCPTDLPADIKNNFRENILPYCRHTEIPIFFARIKYHAPQPIFPDQMHTFAKNVLLITGIADPDPLVEHIEQHYHLLHHMAFKDHYLFTPKDMQAILSTFHQYTEQDKCILTTAKDKMRLQAILTKDQLKNIPIFYLPISMQLLEEEKKFKQLIFEATIC